MTSKAADARRAWEAIRRVFMSDEVHDRFHDACQSIGLPHPGSLKALLSLGAEPAPMRRLAEQLRCDASYITGLVDALEERGYVRRRVSEADRRVKLVELTDKGQAAQEQALAVMATPPAAFARLTGGELRTIARLMEKAFHDSLSQ